MAKNKDLVLTMYGKDEDVEYDGASWLQGPQ
jgi:hypothetical protein